MWHYKKINHICEKSLKVYKINVSNVYGKCQYHTKNVFDTFKVFMLFIKLYVTLLENVNHVFRKC